MKNEGPYILEWIAYHRSIGFDDFILFSNDCTDGSNLMLNRLDQIGVVHHFDNPLGPGMDPQRAAYSRAGKMETARSADWVMIIDADEFVNIHLGDGHIDNLTEACPDADAISLNWRFFGSSGEARMDPAPVTARFTNGSNFETPENGLVWGFKTLFRPRVFDYFGVHRPKFFKDRAITPDMARWVNGSGRDLGAAMHRDGWRTNREQLGYEFGQINHYAIKSREEFLLKRLRGTANSKNKDRIDTGYWDKFDLNACADTSIRAGGVVAAMDELLRDDQLATLHHASFDTARRTIDKQLEDPVWRGFVETGKFTFPTEKKAAKKARKKPRRAAPPATRTPRLLCVGTHHKTGTIWMRKVFRQVAADLGIPRMQVYRTKRLADLPETGPAILFNWSSTFPEELLARSDARFLHLIRDPRDVLLSGVRYHREAGLGNEKFLRETRPEWGGLNYQDHLNALPDDIARLMFEMEHKHDVTLREMLDWPWGTANAAELRYEDLIGDTDCALFRATLDGFAIDGLDIDKVVDIYWQNSLFGGLANADNREDIVARHVASGGAAAQWPDKLPREVAEVYAERYGGALAQLGYADDATWVSRCKPAAELAA